MNIPTYFSHSYRREDQRLNEQYWRLFQDEGFYFSVDPPSTVSTNTHLERMMQRSSCFVAVIPRRLSMTQMPQCSRFVLYELSLALQARRPILLLVDDSLSGGPWDGMEDHEIHRFDPAHPREGLNALRAKIQHLRDRALPATTRPRRPIGLVLPRHRPERCYGGTRTQKEIERAAARHGFAIVPILVPPESNTDLALDLDRCEAVIIGVRAGNIPEWAFAYIHGRLVPSFKLVRVGPDESPQHITLPPLVRNLKMDRSEPAVESLIYWRSAGDLVDQLTQGIRKLDERPVRLEGEHGARYFRGIGRRPARVFISNSNRANDLALTLVEELRLDSVEHFHYKAEDAIETGSNWPEHIKHELEICQVFVALIGAGYRESKWSMKEFRTARRRVSDGVMILPYQLDDSDVSFAGELEVTDLRRRDPQLVPVLKDIAAHLAEDSQGWHARSSILLGGSRVVLIDALRHVPKDGWRKILDQLRGIGIDVHGAAPRASARARGTRLAAEQLLAEVQRAQQQEGRDSPLAALVELLSDVAPKTYRDALGGIHSRLVAPG